MYFKKLDSFTVEKLNDGNYKVVYYGNLKPEVGEEKAYWSQNYKTLYDAIKDLFDGWDFYDISQCQEFRRTGYKVVVPKQEEAWCIHDDGYG